MIDIPMHSQNAGRIRKARRTKNRRTFKVSDLRSSENSNDETRNPLRTKNKSTPTQPPQFQVLIQAGAVSSSCR